MSDGYYIHTTDIVVTDDTRKKFLANVEERNNGCWHWKGNKDSKGYGRLWVGGHEGKFYKAHRLCGINWKRVKPCA